jgi:hypothetical protein
MITTKDVFHAVNAIRNNLPTDGVVTQLVNSLKVYEGRGEFDGSLDSALECLTDAKYEIYHS